MKRLGILGGTFDPIHVGHLILAEETRVALQLDEILFVPAAQPWRKAGRGVSPAPDRMAMVELAVLDNPDFLASRIEILREGPTFTADTLDQLWSEQPCSEFWFILGTDALLDLPNWKDPERILARARLAVASRGTVPRLEMSRLETALPGVSARIDAVPMPDVSISSSDIRRRLAAGVSVRYWVPDLVRDYATEHRLYADGATAAIVS